MVNFIKSELEQININLNEIRRHISFDTEEACEAEHNGKWQKRFITVNRLSQY